MASAAAERYLASLPWEDQQQIRAGGDVDAWYQAAVAAGAVPTAYGGANSAANQARLDQQSGNDWQTDVSGSDVYSSRDWNNATIKDIFDQQYQRLIGMGVAPNRAKRIVSVALGGMEHDWNQYKNASREDILSNLNQWGGAESMVNNFLWGDKSYDPTCPQDAPYRASNGSGCVEKPWDTGEGGIDYNNAGGGAGGAGGSGGGQGAAEQGSLNSPLKELLMNQGGFLSGYDPTKGDSKPGVQGGVVGGGGIWWKPTNQTLASPAGLGPAGTNPNTVGWNDPNLVAGAPLAGAQSWSGAGIGSEKAGAGLSPATTPNTVGWNNPNLVAGASLGGAQSWTGSGLGSGKALPSGTSPNTVGWNNPNITAGAPLGGASSWGGSGLRLPANTSGLVAAMAPLQGGSTGFSGSSPLQSTIGGLMRPQGQPGGLLGAMTPLQRRRQQQVRRWF